MVVALQGVGWLVGEGGVEKGGNLIPPNHATKQPRSGYRCCFPVQFGGFGLPPIPFPQHMTVSLNVGSSVLCLKTQLKQRLTTWVISSYYQQTIFLFEAKHHHRVVNKLVRKERNSTTTHPKYISYIRLKYYNTCLTECNKGKFL